MDVQTIPISKELIPYQFELRLGAELFTFDLRYNDTHDFYTVDLFKDEEVLVLGEKIVYGVPLFRDVEDLRFPVTLITPRDISEQENTITFENLDETVFLVVEKQ